MRNEVIQFLNDFKFKMDFWGLVIRTDRTNNKNTQTLLALEYNYTHVCQILKDLELKDYSEGPVQDTLYHISAMWIFGKVIKGREIYIKIQLGHPESKTICISFHFAEYKMHYPFK
jgi:hypothetical protein